MVAELTSDATRSMEWCAQDGAALRFDWGLDGLEALAATSAVVVVVDVLRFTTAVCCALESGAVVLPYRWDDEQATAYGLSRGALLAGRRERGEPSLSPTDLLTIESGTRLVLPSPNGSAIAARAGELGVPHVLAGCLRNATAVARAAQRLCGGGAIGVIAAGERWHDAGGSLRPAVEDMIGAGAVLAAIDPAAAVGHPRCSAEAAAARAAFMAARPRLAQVLADCASGRELIARGWEDDVSTAASLDVATMVPTLVDGEFVPLP